MSGASGNTYYALILEITVDSFSISKADDKLKDKIEFARVVASADSAGQAGRLRRDMSGE
jgi:hypothetical protein